MPILLLKYLFENFKHYSVDTNKHSIGRYKHDFKASKNFITINDSSYDSSDSYKWVDFSTIYQIFFWKLDALTAIPPFQYKDRPWLL